MEHLGIMKQAILFLVFGLAVAHGVSGQVLPPEISAFEQSYAAEASGSYPEAIARLEPFLTNTHYEVSLRLGWLHYLNGDFPLSVKHYRQAMKLMPYAIEPKLGYVLPLAGLGNWDEVMAIYEEILHIDPQNTLVHYRMGVIFYERGNFEEAFRHVEKVVNLYPFDYDSVVLFAWIHLRMQRLEKAKILFQKALMIQPPSESAREGLRLLE